jgi:hypothetical protein
MLTLLSTGFLQGNTVASQTSEICNNSIDDDLDMKIDSEDSDCAQTGLNRSVWVYKSSIDLSQATIDDFYQKGIRTLYISGVYAGLDSSSQYSQLLSFINYAKSRGMTIYGVCLEDTKYIDYSESQLRSEFSAIVTKYKQIFNSGFVIDVEPHMLDDWSSSTEASYLKKYVSMSNILRSEADKHVVVFADTVPWWYHKKLKEVAGFPNGIDALGGHFIILMVYTRNAHDLANESNHIVIVNETDKPKVISLNITPSPDGDPYLSGSEITRGIRSLENLSTKNTDIIGVAFFKSNSLLRLPFQLFT